MVERAIRQFSTKFDKAHTRGVSKKPCRMAKFGYNVSKNGYSVAVFGFFLDFISSMGDHFVKNSMKSMKWQKYRYNVSTKWLFT